MLGRGVVGDITFASSFCCASGKDMLGGLLTDRKAAMVCLILSAALMFTNRRKGRRSKDQREGEAALKKPVTFVRLRPGPGALGRFIQQGDRGNAGRGGGGMAVLYV